jgi:hypothetical protein
MEDFSAVLVAGDAAELRDGLAGAGFDDFSFGREGRPRDLGG